MTAPTSLEISTAKRGDAYTMLYAAVDVLSTVTFDASNWSTGLTDNASFSDLLRTDTVDGGSWTGSIPLESLIDESQGVNISWNGQGVTVSWSTDNVTWTPVDNRRTFLEDVDTEGLFLYIRIDLDDDESWVEWLRLDILADRTMQSFSGVRELAFKGASFDYEAEHQSAFVDDSGAFIQDGYIEIQPDVDETEIATVEAWIRTIGTDGRLLSVSGSAYVAVAGGSYTFIGLTAYRNGEEVTSGPFPVDEWAHWVFVLNTPVNSAIRLGDQLTGGATLDMAVGHLATYDYAMDDVDVARLYSYNIGAPVISITDDSLIRVTEPAPALDVYAYSWSTVPA